MPATTRLPNPTNAVGGSFILSLQKGWTHPGPKSHQRSWWIVHTQPTCDILFSNSANAAWVCSQLPSRGRNIVQESTNFVGGIRDRVCAQPFCRPSMNNPPTALVGFGTGCTPSPFVG